MVWSGFQDKIELSSTSLSINHIEIYTGVDRNGLTVVSKQNSYSFIICECVIFHMNNYSKPIIAHVCMYVYM